MPLSCPLTIVAVGIDLSMTRMNDVSSLEAAVAFYDRVSEEGTWPKESSLWAVGKDCIFSYDPEVDKWVSLEGLATDILIDSIRPTIN